MSRHSPRQHLLDGFPDAAVRFFRALEAHRSRLAAEHGLSEIELRCLFRIGAAGSVTPKELSTALSVSKGAVTGITTRLVSSGLVHRVEHPQDRRSLHLELTAAGHDATRTMHRDLRRLLSADGTDVGDDDLAAATTVLDRLARRLDADPRDPG
ncbi:MarR family transcriptional regulator [Rathayibacter sp. VKM Ac-2759]|uniref:MarR family winged helix-turn-helix transcriptional regulator n=1 Tax=Rathayibacter sp. VKM Ac-2759 TaxID=2609252 RepID=UPI0013196D4B|nr:MarR family transcriptional regulator [Rathayibacter sp. VKM Ac-2759]QHC66228.1 MarR family transcriptional regulator [Rathayibacter sp. VKM Ac-2759]